MKKEYFYLAAGKIFVDILKDRNNIIYDKEELRRFNIGLLNIEKSNDSKESASDEKYINKLADPYYMGYFFQLWLQEETPKLKQPTNSSPIVTDSFSKHNQEEYMFKTRYNLQIPDIMPFFAPDKDVNFTSYLNFYRDNSTLDVKSTQSDPKIMTLENDLVVLANQFYFSWQKEINKINNRRKSKKHDIKWKANETQYKYYKQRMKEICDKISDTNKSMSTNTIDNKNLSIFFDGLIKELNDVSTQSDNTREAWDKEERHIMKLSTWIIIINAVVVFSNLISEKLPTWLFWIPSAVALLATIISAIQGYLTMRKNHKCNRETWLRHQLYYSNLIGEIEEFCQGIGKYNTLSDKPEDIKNAVKLFQEQIAKHRRQDYANFFINMNCINYNNEDIDKDQNHKSDSNSAKA